MSNIQFNNATENPQHPDNAEFMTTLWQGAPQAIYCWDYIQNCIYDEEGTYITPVKFITKSNDRVSGLGTDEEGTLVYFQVNLDNNFEHIEDEFFFDDNTLSALQHTE